MEITTFVIALIGCVGTILTWVFYFWNSRVSVLFEINGYFDAKTDFIVNCSLTNKSNTPVSITNVSLRINGKSYDVYRFETVILSHEEAHGSQIISREETKNAAFPINLYPLVGENRYLLFPLDRSDSLPFDTNLTFQIQTNRNRQIRYSIELSKVPHLFQRL